MIHQFRLFGVIALIVFSSAWQEVPATASPTYPVGVVNPDEPSKMSPPGPTSLVGYRQTYVNDFGGTHVPRGWDLFTGVPGGDAGGRFSFSHVQVSKGLLQINSYRDPAYANRWVTGGMCQCGRSMTYGAYFVRSRVTNPGTNTVELLWPANNVWPPEIDFNENLSHLSLTTATTHWGDDVNFDILRINMSQWHTWGVIWTRNYVEFVVDGVPWHKFATASDVPHVPMVLDFETRTTCSTTIPCPTESSSLLIDWVVEYQRAR